MNDNEILEIANDIHADLLLILRDGKIPDHDHWNDNSNCDTFRNLIAAIVRKHIKGKL